MESEKTNIFSNIWTFLWVCGIIYGMISLAGLTYKSLRLAFNFEVMRARVIACDSSFHRGSKEFPDYFEFEIFVEGINYPIIKSSTRKGLKKIPKYNWCEIEGDTVEVYYYDKVKTAIIPEFKSKNPGYFTLLRATDSGIVGLILISILVIVALVFGIRFYIHSIGFIFQKVKPKQETKRKELKYIRYFNGMILPAISMVMAFLLFFLIGLGFAFGLFQLEHLNSFVTGLIFTLGIAFATFGPGLLFWVIYYVKTSDNQYLALFKNAFIIAALTKLITNFMRFFRVHSLRELDITSIKEILVQILEALF